MNQVNSQIYQQLKHKINLDKAQDKNCIQAKNDLIVKNIAEDNGFFFLVELVVHQTYKAIIRVWQNHQAEVVMVFDTDWKPVYETRNGVEFPNHKLREQVNQSLLSLLS